MNLRQMHYFTAVVDKASMTRAAEFCNVAQTALSMQIRQLEEELAQVLKITGAGAGRLHEPQALAQCQLFQRKL
ncbi:MAG: LysR family transcriptional regulator [Alphaproteobacteria bacterium]|nr:LysR family transcriptional regulator [Alphaproteobacteria bacterium]